jgi:hypothetical protein
MGPSEIVKRIGQHGQGLYSKAKYADASRWPYHRFAVAPLSLRPMPSAPLDADFERFRVLGRYVDLTNEVDWHESDVPGVRWPDRHYAELSYRPGNPCGDVRINWELNRLQFLPLTAAADPLLALRLLESWVCSNPYQHGSGYLTSMEVALRWFEIYWAVCLLRDRVPGPLLHELSGLAAASGKFIEDRLSTHSSTGNHLILEAVGLQWVGVSLSSSREGRRWVALAREILWREIPRQINADGSSVEQSFWYLGFVVDALLHYLLLENRAAVPENVRARVLKAIDFLDGLMQDDGTFPDFGDRDDGVVFRDGSEYGQTHLPGLIAAGRVLLGKSPGRTANRLGGRRLSFWGLASRENGEKVDPEPQGPRMVTYSQCGMTLLEWGKLRILFRHAPLGLLPMSGHGHADALSVLLWWGRIPILIDVGSGQYNGSQVVRNYFRSTIAHNTVELAGQNQARILGPFLWGAPYRVVLEGASCEKRPWAAAHHDGYRAVSGLIHRRQVELLSPRELRIRDSYRGGGRAASRTAFHFPRGTKLGVQGDQVSVETGSIRLVIRLEGGMATEVHQGSTEPFLGWRSPLYAHWESIPTLVVRGEAKESREHDSLITVLNE